MTNNLKYNFFNDNFLVYEAQPKPDKVELDLPVLKSPIDISDWASRVTDDGIPIVRNDYLPSMKQEMQEDEERREDLEYETPIEQEPPRRQDIPIEENDDEEQVDPSLKEPRRTDQLPRMEQAPENNLVPGTIYAPSPSELEVRPPSKLEVKQPAMKIIPKVSEGETRANAEKVISTLMEDLDLTRAQAAGIAGVITFESSANPESFNKREKAGTYKKSGANNLGKAYGHKNSPWSYGAGICQWTFTDRKEKAIMGGLGVSRERAKYIITHGGIESLSLDQQIKMLEYELTNSYKEVLEGVRKCDNAAEAAATFHCHAISGHSRSTEKATREEIEEVNARHYRIGVEIPVINRSMGYAEGYMWNYEK